MRGRYNGHLLGKTIVPRGSTLQVDGKINYGNELFVLNESDFTVQDTTTILIPDGTHVKMLADITTGKKFNVGKNVTFEWSSAGPTLTTTTSGIAFSGTNTSVNFINCRLSAPNASQHFQFSGVGEIFQINTSRIIGHCNKFGTFQNMLSVLFEFSDAEDCDDGITILGGVSTLDVNAFALVSTSSSFVGIDLTSNVFDLFVGIERFVCVAPAGGIYIDGLPDSGNVAKGLIGKISDGSATGGMSTSANIADNDLRWQIETNPPYDNSSISGDVHLPTQREVTISAPDTYYVVDGADWVPDTQDRFYITNTGLLIYLFARSSKCQVISTAVVEKVLGGADQICCRVAINGVTQEKTESCTKNTTPTALTSQGLFRLQRRHDGSHTGSSGAATLADSAASFTTGGGGLTNYAIVNITDKSWGLIISNTAQTITATLAGGTDNDWDAGDQYIIGDVVNLWVKNVDNANNVYVNKSTISCINGF